MFLFGLTVIAVIVILELFVEIVGALGQDMAEFQIINLIK